MARSLSVPHRGMVRYDQLEVSRSGLDDHDAADLSAGRAVFLPWAKPGPVAAQPLPSAVVAAGRGGILSLTDLSVFFASPQSARMAGLMDWFRAEGASVGFDQDLPRALAGLRQNPACWSALIVHADGFGDLEDLVDMLLAFRRAVPALPLILISDSFGRDTPGTERLSQCDVSLCDASLCDASLCDPVGLGRMKSVLDLAVQNNRTWQQRLAALTPAQLPQPPAPTAPPRRLRSRQP